MHRCSPYNAAADCEAKITFFFLLQFAYPPKMKHQQKKNSQLNLQALNLYFLSFNVAKKSRVECFILNLLAEKAESNQKQRSDDLGIIFKNIYEKFPTIFFTTPK